MPAANDRAMCTVTAIFTPDGGFRLVASRDEQRGRPASLPPRAHDLGLGRRGLWPVDAKAGGTWAAVGSHGLAGALLNLNPEPGPALPAGLLSRGSVLPALLRAPDAASAAAEWAVALDLARLAPFRVLLAGPGMGDPVWELRWDRERPRRIAHERGPVCLASSGLGDSIAEARLPLFDGMVRPDPTPVTQDAFHDHAWPGRGAESVRMSRADAQTVSVTTIEVRPAGAPTLDCRVLPSLPSDDPRRAAGGAA
jgi:hypothetical protein